MTKNAKEDGPLTAGTEITRSFANPMIEDSQDPGAGVESSSQLRWSTKQSADYSATELSPVEIGEDSFEAEGHYVSDARLGRHKGCYAVLMLATLILLPCYTAFGVFMIWAFYVIPNPFSFICMVFACFMPLTLYMGYKGARSESLPQLQLYAFMMILAVTMQASVAIVVRLDDGALERAYLQTCVAAARDACSTKLSNLWGGSLLPQFLCDCAAEADGSSDGNDGARMFECVRGYIEANAGGGKSAISYGLIATMTVEVILAQLGWNLMVDLDAKDAKKAAKMKGGAPTGSLRGEVICGEDLLSIQSTRGFTKREQRQVKKMMKKSPAEKKKGASVKIDEISTRYVTLSLLTPGLDNRNKQHITQKTQTAAVEDDDSPMLQHRFGNWVMYEASKQLRVQVFDQIGKSPVEVGSAIVEVDGEELPDFSYVMDGDDEDSHVVVPLTWTDSKSNAKNETVLPAGEVHLSLIFVPAPQVNLNNASIITKTWYFEATVLGMVWVSMFVLAQQSPAAPPSVLAQGALRILEIFVATHMLIELLMEVWVLTAGRESSRWWRDPWMLLAFAVLACNWISIIAPTTEVGEQLEPQTMTPGPVTDADQTGARTAAAANLVSGVDETDYYQAAIATMKRLVSLTRVFRIVRPIRTLRMVKNVDMVVTVLSGSAPLFLTVCGLLLFLMGVFALIGMSSYSGALQYECIGHSGDIGDESVPKPVCSAEQQLSAERMNIDECPIRCPHSLECSKHHLWCAPLQGGRRQVGNDRFGFRDYDNFWRGIVTMFVQTTGDGGMHTMPMALYDAGVSNTMAAWAISFAGSVMLNLIALNLFLAVCCSAYSEIASQSQELAIRRKKWLTDKRDRLLRRESAEAKALREQKEEQQLVLDTLSNLTIEQRIDMLDWSQSPWRGTVTSLILSVWFERITSLIIVGNTISMMCVYQNMDPELKQLLGTIEAGFLVCFIVEACLKFIGMGKTLYFASKSNVFDLIIIMCTVVGYLATYAPELTETAGLNLESVQSLRAVRLLRALQIARLLHRQKALIVVLKTIFSAWRPLLIHTFFCAFSMSMFAIISMHVFGGALGSKAQLEDYDTELESNFETFSRGFLTIFEMTVGEDWSHTMYWYSKFGNLGHGYWEWAVQLYFVVMYVWMNCILFSLYVAMLLGNFTIAEEDKIPTQKRVYERQIRHAERKMRKINASALVQTLHESQERGHSHTSDGSAHDKLQHAAQAVDITNSDNKSLYIFTLDHPLRLGAAKLQANQYFSRAIMILIVFSCAALALEGPGEASPAQGHLRHFFAYINVLVLAFFIIEALLKCVIHGFIFKSGPTKPYLATKMNRMDFIIVLLCTATYVPFVPLDGTWARALRLGRVITPIINLTKNPQIKLVFISFVRAGPDTAVVLLPLLLMGIVFSILGVATFGGQLQGCIVPDDPHKMLSEDDAIAYGNGTAFVHDNQTLCEAVGLEWTSQPFNFDSCPEGLATLMTMITDGAHGLMVETTADNPGAVSYWILFHLTFTCFLLNLFIGVLSASFEKSSGVATRTIGEKQWTAAARGLHTFRPSITDVEDLRPVLGSTICGLTVPIWWHNWRTLTFTLSTNEQVETFWRLSIFANTVTLATDQYPIDEVHVDVVSHLNLMFLIICTAEVVVKMTGLGYKHFFGNGWLISDLILVTVSIALRLSGVQSGVEVLRVMRVFRMVVLASKIPALVSLIDTLVKCLRASMALVLITSLIVYLYSIIGMNMFGLLPTEQVLVHHNLLEREEELRNSYTILSETCPHCESYTDYTNFSSFLHAFRLLMQVTFGQEIAPLVKDMQYLGAGYWKTFLFFASFYCLAVWVCINLLIVTVLSNFDAATMEAQSGESEILVDPDMDGFSHCWACLTIGPHMCRSVEKMAPALLKHLQHCTESEAKKHGQDYIEPQTVNFEDGAPSTCGTLTIRVQEVNNLGAIGEHVRPYAKLSMCGPSMTSKLRLVTPSAKPNADGTAVWSDKRVDDDPNTQRLNGSDASNEMVVHVTTGHTHLDFEVRNSFQFCDQIVGGATIHLDAIRNKQKCTEIFNLRADTMSARTLPSGDRERWERHKHFCNSHQQQPDIQEHSDAGNDTGVEPTSPKSDEEGEISPVQIMKTKKELQAEKRAAKDVRREDKQANRQHKKAEKQARRLKKQLAKQEAKMQKKKKKMEKKKKKKKKKKDEELKGNIADSEQENEPEKEVTPHRFFRHGWAENGVSLKVTFEYEPMVVLVPKKTFLSDYYVRYAHKESNCGVEGWLEVSENGSKFKRQFCYLQQYPHPCIKMVRNASDFEMLEAKALHNALAIHSVSAEQIMSLRSGHSKVAASTLIRKNVSFEMVTTESRRNGAQEEALIGLMGGVVLRAFDLKSADKPRGVSLVKDIHFVLPQGQDPDILPEEDLGFYTAAGEYVMEEAVEEFVQRGESQLNPPEMYMAAKSVTLRAGSSLESAQLGSLEKGEVVAALAEKVQGEGIVWLRCSLGWVPTRTTRATTLMIPELSKNQHFEINRACQVTDSLSLTNSRPAGEALRKGDVVEAHEQAIDPDTGVPRIRVHQGWISEIDVDVKATPDPYCVLEIVSAVQDDGKPKNPQSAVSAKTQTIEDDLSPDWNHGFDFKIFPSSSKLRVQVYDANSRRPTLMGCADMEIGEYGIPGPRLSGASLRGGCAHLQKQTTEIEVALMGTQGEDAGRVVIDVNFIRVVSHADLLEARDKSGGDLAAGMMVDQMRPRTIQFRAMSKDHRRHWLAALRWIAEGCQGSGMDRLPASPMFKSEMERVTHDISLLDLPFNRVSLLLKGLYARRVMGGHKPTGRRLLYTIFNLETFAWSNSTSNLGKKRKLAFAGISLREIRGLNFHLVLERLSLLHYGKRRCLSYEQQMIEYQTEVHHTSLHVVSTCVGLWVARRRSGKEVGGELWPSHPAWRRFPLAYQRALVGVAASRLRTLSLLLGEVHKRGKPELMDVVLAPREKDQSNEPDEQQKTGLCRRKAPGNSDDNSDTPEMTSASRVEVKPKEEMREALSKLFKEIDVDDSGFIDHGEVKEALVVMMGDGLEDHEVDRMIGIMDENMDGELDEGEFVEGMLRVADTRHSDAVHHGDDTDSDLDELDMSIADLTKKLFASEDS